MASGGRHIGSVLSIILSLAIALTLAVKLWPDPAQRQNTVKRPEAVRQKPEPLSVARVRLPPPPEPPARIPPTATVAVPMAAPKATVARPQPVVMVVTPLKPVPVAAAKPRPAPAVEKPVVTPLKPEPRPQPPVRPSKRSKPDTPPTPPSPTVKIDKAVAAEGRTLLRLLEHGEGPAIEIAWPSGADARTRLFGYLRNCLGMRVALMDGENGFYLASGRPGVATRLNLDRYSGFMRYPAGRVSNAERRLVASIRARHGMAGATPVRLFPRTVDAALLGGLNTVVGETYAAAKSIRAIYRRDSGGLYVSNLRVDGRKVGGRILLSNRRCSHSGV